MSYRVIARKWRPQTFADLVGQTHVSQTLINALRHGRLHHALLLTGPRGTGKTSSARILAKAVRCLNAVDFVPCGVCKDCEDIALSRALDVLEIDGASNNGVENIRELIDRVSYMPSSGTRKVYIIDEVHMLSTSAFNALLKTLEEPPPHILFIMATTEVHKIPNTVLSRCQRFDFRRISTALVTDQLETICKSEGITADREALWLMARQGEGSMRDSLSLLDQVITFSDGAISLQQTLDVLGLTDRRLLIETIEAFVRRDPTKAIAVCEKIFTAGYDAKIFIQDVLEILRNVLFLKLSGSVDLPESEGKALRELTVDFSIEDIHLLFDMALKGAQDLIRAPDSRIVLEMVLLRMCEAPRVQSLARLLSSTVKTPEPAKVKSETRPAAPPMTTATIAVPVTLTEKWQDLVHKIKGVNAVVGAKLENSSLKSLTGQTLVVGIPPKLKFLYDQVQEPDFQKKVQNYLTTFWGPGHTLHFELSEGDTLKTLEVQRAKKEQSDLHTQVQNHPFVKSTQQIFKSEIKAIKETK